MNNTYLAHHGILGMKWGVRRSEAQLARARGHSSKSSDDKNEVSARKAAVKNRTQTLDTSGKVLSEDLVIHEVPYYQTSNASGGVTSYIAKEGDSK